MAHHPPNMSILLIMNRSHWQPCVGREPPPGHTVLAPPRRGSRTLQGKHKLPIQLFPMTQHHSSPNPADLLPRTGVRVTGFEVDNNGARCTAEPRCNREL